MSALQSPSARRAERRWVLIGVVSMALLLCVQVAVGFLRQEASFLEKVKTCFTERSTPFEDVSGDPVASSAQRGALRTIVEGNGVTVALGGSESDAERLYDAYVSVVPADVVGMRLQRNRKVVLLWDNQPSSSQHEFMLLCTLDAQE